MSRRAVSSRGRSEQRYHILPTRDMDDYFRDENKFSQLPWEDPMGMRVTSGTVHLQKDSQNLIGISIGGGAPYCPCLYVVQIFDNTPASTEGTLAAGDELVGVNGQSVKGRTKVEVARMIQSRKNEVTINYNKLHADPKQGKSLDIVLKKVKHKVVETMSSSTADALGLSRAILCNDGLVKKLNELEKTASMYKGLMEHTKRLLKCFFDLSQSHKAFGDVFAGIGVREPQPAASEAFTMFGEAHREIERFAVRMLKTVKPMVDDLNTFIKKAVPDTVLTLKKYLDVKFEYLMMGDLNTFLHKALPDTRLTIKKYLDVKFEYLSYCLKVKEMDDEEYSYAALQEPLYRVETGNYEYRLILRCRQDARSRFAKMRSDVLVKLELLDNKHVQDIVFQLQRLVNAMARYHNDCHDIMKGADVFPIEVDLSRGTFTYDATGQINDGEEEEEEEGEEEGQEATQALERPQPPAYNNLINMN